MRRLLFSWTEEAERDHSLITTWGTPCFARKHPSPAPEGDDWHALRSVLLLQPLDENRVIGQGLLHAQQANVRPLQGRCSEWKRFPIIPLTKKKKGGGR